MDLAASLDKILASDHEFGEMFYDVFFEQYPVAKDYFEGVNMRNQALMLSVSLRLIGDYHKRGFAAIGHYLQILGTRHADRRVPQEMYPLWRDSLLTTLDKFHNGDWSGALANEWSEAIEAISQVMFEGYDKRTGL